MHDDATQSLLYWLATSTMVLSLLCGTSLFVVQYLADNYFWQKAITMPFLSPTEIAAFRHSVSRQSLLLLGVYSLEAATALAALLCHLAMPSYHLEPVCLTLYFACKTSVYFYWLEKAKQQCTPAQLRATRTKRLIVALSSWLVLFAVCATVACFALLRGEAPDTSADTSADSAWGSTRFTIAWPGLLLIAMALDWLHCVGLNACFVAAHFGHWLGLVADGTVNRLPSEEMAPQIAQLNIHVLCCLIATMSTSVTLAVLLSGVQFVAWLAVAVDVMVNALAMFFTHTANREYADKVLCCKLSTTVLCQRVGLLKCSCWWCCVPLMTKAQSWKERKSSRDEEEDEFENDVDFERMVELELEQHMQNFTRKTKSATDGEEDEEKVQEAPSLARERERDCSGMLGLLNSLQI